MEHGTIIIIQEQCKKVGLIDNGNWYYLDNTGAMQTGMDKR